MVEPAALCGGGVVFLLFPFFPLVYFIRLFLTAAEVKAGPGKIRMVMIAVKCCGTLRITNQKNVEYRHHT